MAAYPKNLEGLCVGVLSGDRILFQGPPDHENGGFKQKILHLSGVQSPKVDGPNSKEEPYGYAAREYMRKQLVGTFALTQAISSSSLSRRKLTKLRSATYWSTGRMPPLDSCKKDSPG